VVRRERVETPRLVLVPIPRDVAAEILDGNLSGVRAGEGWPLEDSLVPMRTAARYDVEPGWFVTLSDLVIGDCHTHGWVPDDQGSIEIGYNLAEAYRGRGYGTELVTGLSRWLLGQAGVERIVARRVPVENVPSRRALERAGFVLEKADDQYSWYALTTTD